MHRYLNLLETSFLLVRVPAYAVNRTKRLIKTPRLYDVGLALHLVGLALAGQTGARKARQHLTIAAAMYGDMGMDFWLAQAETVLESVGAEARRVEGSP